MALFVIYSYALKSHLVVLDCYYHSCFISPGKNAFSSPNP
jgi:hypothetical protein